MKITRLENKSTLRSRNQPYATLTLASALREMFGVQLYKNNARVLLSRIMSILNLDWLQHARGVRGVYELILTKLKKSILPKSKYSSVGPVEKSFLFPRSAINKCIVN